MSRQLLIRMLQGLGAEVDSACSGQAAQAVSQSDTHWNAVLMDFQMPVMDGLTAARHICQTHPASVLPIVAMTANVTPADRQACRNAGMNEHVGKPFVLDQLAVVLLATTATTTNRVAPPASHPSSSPAAIGSGMAQVRGLAQAAATAEGQASEAPAVWRCWRQTPPRPHPRRHPTTANTRPGENRCSV